jgi:hypothetical protein
VDLEHHRVRTDYRRSPKKDSLTRSKLKVAGRTADIVVETFEFKEAERWTSRTIESFIDVEVGTRREDANGGTEVTFRQRIGPFPGGIFAKLYEPLVVRIIRRDMRVSLQKLKELLEAE